MYQSIKYLLFSFCALFAFALTLNSCGSDDNLKGFSKDAETVIVGSNGNHFTIQLGKNRADKDYYYFEIPKTSNGTKLQTTEQELCLKKEVNSTFNSPTKIILRSNTI